uniref:CCHC-type domain-containing protein n=1 Tax=Bactrocera tryoni TaxID=59916 RepID=A0A142LX44_BACRY|nr:hypothetical protein [Bactrocera tryoni]
MENNLRKYTKTNSSSVPDCMMSNGTQSPGSMFLETDLSRETPTISGSSEADPFKRAPRLMRSPKQALVVEKPVRARSSPPALQDSTPRAEPTQPKGDIMSELGDMIKRLTEAMKLPQRSINNQIRDLLTSVTKLHERAQSEYNKIKESRRNVLLRHAGVDSTPKRPREDEQLTRKTPPKKKASQEEVQKRTTACKRNEGNIPTKERKAEEQGNEWTQVKRKTQNPIKKAVFAPRPRPDAIIIARTGNMSYSDMLRAVKKEDALKELGENVSRIRKTAKGEILLEMKKAQMKNTGAYEKEICKVLGDQAQIRALTHEVSVEIRDLDEITTKEDIAVAIRSQIKELNSFDENAIKTMRQAYAGTQTAVISLPAADSKRLLDAHKIKIGWVVCRIREKPNLRKCFRCLEYGHLARACTSEDDRSKCCAKCGEKGHFAKECDKSPSCAACKSSGKKETGHRIGSWKCPLYQAACKKTK